MHKTIAQATEDINHLARGRVKAAEIGGGQDMPFESAFSNLAHAYLKDKAPGLLDYELGFQLLDRNQENTKAVGIFGFKIGSQFLYAPVFFLNGKLKGHELLYIKSQDMFVPLKENWLNYLLNRRPGVLGEGVTRNLHHMGVMPPHLFQLSRSPQKFAADLRSKLAVFPNWTLDVVPEYAEWATTNPGKQESPLKLPEILKEANLAATQSMLKLFKHWPQVKKAFNRFYPDTVIEEVLEHHRKKTDEAASISVLKEAAGQMGGPSYPMGEAHAASMSPGEARCRNTPEGLKCYNVTPRKDQRSVLGGSEINTEPGDEMLNKASAVAVLTYDEVLHHGTALHQLDSNDRDKLMKDKILVRDERPETSVAYEVQTELKLQNPDETGIYDVLCRPHKIERCLIVIGPYQQNRRELFCTVVRLDGEKQWLNIHPSNIWTVRKYDTSEFRRFVDELPEADTLSSDNGLYMLINSFGNATLPFDVRRSVGDDTYKSYDVSFRRHAELDRPDHLPPLKYSGESQAYYDRWYMNRGERITFTGKHNAKFRAVGGDLYIGKGTKLLTIRASNDDECGCFAHSSDPSPIMPGNMLDIETMLGQKTAMLKLAANVTEVQVNGKAMSKLAALIHLIRDHGLREAQARYLLKRAEQERSTKFRIKYASYIKQAQDPYYELQKTGPGAPPFPEPYVGTDALTGNQIPTMQFSEYNLKIPDMSAANTDRSQYLPLGPEPDFQGSWPPAGPPMPDQQAKGLVMQAAQTGQKEVFDTAMIGSLLKAVRDDNMIDKYMGDLTKGMDRLGRILFLFYWHNEKFADRYGQADMVELEDGLRNAFEGMGDIVLFLKQRAIDAYPDELGNPDIKEVASA